MTRIQYIDCDCGFCPAVFETKDEANSFRDSHRHTPNTFGITRTYSVRRLSNDNLGIHRWAVYLN